MRTTTTIVLFCTTFLAALGSPGVVRASDESALGTGIGAALGGLLGSQVGRGSGQLLSTGIGITVGGIIGNNVGHQLEEDRRPSYRGYGPNYDQSTVFYYPTYQYTPNYVAPPAPPPTYIDQNEGTYCRPYSQEIRIDGKIMESYGTACLQPDGTWRIVQ